MSGGNPYHDEKGRFTDGPSGGGGGAVPGDMLHKPGAMKKMAKDADHGKSYAKEFGLSKEHQARSASAISEGVSEANRESAHLRLFGDPSISHSEHLDRAAQKANRAGAAGDDQLKHKHFSKAHALERMRNQSVRNVDKQFSNPKKAPPVLRESMPGSPGAPEKGSLNASKPVKYKTVKLKDITARGVKIKGQTIRVRDYQ